MKARTALYSLIVAVGMLLPHAVVPVWGDPPPETGAVPVEQPQTAPADIAVPTLKTIVESLAEYKRQVDDKERELDLVRTEEQKARVLRDLADLNARMTALARDFERIATGVNIDVSTARPRERFDWQEEIQEILGPLIKELKGLTARPREIERLRSEVAYFENQVTVAKNAVQNLQKLLSELDEQDEALRGRLLEVEKGWRQREQAGMGQLAVVNYQLTEELKKQKPFLESFQDVMQSFFKSRGRNFVLAVLAAGLVVVLCRAIYRLVYRFSPLHKADERTFSTRLSDLIYYLLTFVAANGAFLLVLYLAGDWVLLSVAFLFLLGIIWTARQTVPKFWNDAKFLLNLGTVREGERLLYGGIPWKVEALNFHTQLLNPNLKGGLLRLPLKDLMNLTSRPYEPEEPWFPCKEKEWVLLADGTLGRVQVQTPEMVTLLLPGGGCKTYPTAEFLKQNPTNLSAGFRLNVSFRLDPRHQKESLRAIPEKLQEVLERELGKESFAKDLLGVRVEFTEARRESLDFVILVEFGGKAARHYDRLTRMLPRIALEACNEQGWVIPFPQLTFYDGVTEEGEDEPTAEVPTKERRRWSFWRG